MPDVCTVLDPYVCHSREDLVRCLEQYATLRGRPKIAKIGEGGSEGELPERYDIMLRQNSAIDRAMSALKPRNKLGWRLLDSYYRLGLHEEAAGWERCLLRVDLPHRPNTHGERMLLERVWEVLLAEATDSLLYAHKVRSERAGLTL
jgi:hypothetical protein